MPMKCSDNTENDMRERGIVTEVKGNIIEVIINRKSACGGNCAQCGGCTAGGTMVRALNSQGAKKGDMVELELDERKVLKAAFLVYIIPLLIFVVSYFVSAAFIKNNIICAATAFIFLLISFFLLHFYDRKKGGGYMPKAVLAVSGSDKENEICSN